jgi:hypothetical protein
MTTQRVQPKTPRDVNAAMRVAEAIKLRAKKVPYDEIAKQCGYADKASCYNAIQRELQRIVVEDIDELRREELHTYDVWQAEVSTLFFDKDNKGRLFALDRLLAISEARRKLLGLDQDKTAAVKTPTVIRELPAGYLGGAKDGSS